MSGIPETFEDYDEGSERSHQSVSDYEGSPSEAPTTMFFSADACRARFQTKNSEVLRICGRRVVACNRRGHHTSRLSQSVGPVGFYRTIRTGKDVDGDFSTYMSETAMEAQNEARRRENIAMLEESIGLTARTSSDSETTSWTMPEVGSAEVGGTGAETRERVTGVQFREPVEETVYPNVTAKRGSRGEGGTSPIGSMTPGVAENRTNDPIPRVPQQVSQEDFANLQQQVQMMLNLLQNGAQAPRGPQDTIPTPPRDRPTTTTPDMVYVAVTPAGATGIYMSYARAKDAATTGGTCLAYDSMESAMAFINSLGPMEEEPVQAGVPITGPPRFYRPTPLPEHLRPAVRPHELALGDEGYLPPLALGGPDPDKERDRFYGVEIGSEPALRRSMAPPDATEQMTKDLAAVMLDAVALPGTLAQAFGGDDGAAQQVTDLGLVGGAIQELVEEVAQERVGGDRLKTDYQWNQLSRISIRSIKDEKMLRERLSDLTQLRDMVLRHLGIRLKNILTGAGWPEQRAQMWAIGGYHYKMSLVSLDGYMALHMYLIGLVSKGAGWTYVQKTIEYHVKQLVMIRTLHDHRLQAMCSVYCYMRKGLLEGWRSAALDSERIQELHSVLIPSAASTVTATAISESTSTGTPKSNFCTKCRTALHSGGRNKCPFKKLSDKDAVAAGAKALLTAGGVTPTEEPSP